MITAIRTGKQFDYTSKLDEDEPKTVFKLGLIDFGLMAELQDEYGVSSSNDKGRWNQLSAELLRFGLKGFDNFTDPDGNKVLFKTEESVRDTKKYTVVHSDTLNAIPFEVRVELAAEILQLNTLTEQDRKNSK